MTQYRKKPDVIEAWPVRELNRAARHEWKALPQSMRDAYRQGGWVFGVFKTDNDATSGRGIYIPTPAGSLWAAPEDMVIRGVNGEFYPCKPDIFAASYEPVAPPMTPADPIPSPVTPEPLSAEELTSLETGCWFVIDNVRKVASQDVKVPAVHLLRLIAQARAALSFSAEMKSVIRSRLASMSDEEIVRIGDELAREQEEARAAARPSPWQKVTRVEVIAERGRAFTRWDCHLEHTDSMFQDDGRTLKLFVKGGTPTSPPAQGRRTPVVNELPSIEEMAGSVSDVTGGQTLEDFMRWLRDE